MNGLARAFAPFAAALLEQARRINPRAYVSSGRRSSRVQAGLYRDYLAGRSRFPAAPPGRSKHERGLAVDIGGVTSRQLSQLGRLWRRWGGRWGGTFKKRDPIHFETPGG